MPYAEGSFRTTGTGRHRAPEQAFQETLVPPEPGWDPAEELAFLLQDAVEQQHTPAPSYSYAAEQQYFAARPAEQQHTVPYAADASSAAPAPGTPLSNLQEITAELPPLREAPPSHRRVRRRMSRLRAASLFVAALAAVIAASVSLFGGMVAYEPLRLAAVTRTSNGVVSWWPLLVYGPWLVASLAVLRAALHQRRAVHSWAVVLLFSAIAMFLCIAQAPRTLDDGAAAALPGLASLICFQQTVRQITLTRPPRRTTPRHRQPAATTQGDETADAGTAREPLPLPQQRKNIPSSPQSGTRPVNRG
ncbi:DUF2637 domain-containing protein [Streptomyces sp. NPDC057245]|uniref:DUF2637 domain-containing protein n=1 Tax=Streptomyces TaxID=1883 RepID=UPI001C1E2220|nr:DUF2637 domain-containing protein [Streptomyces sp. A108]MBU6534614.1 hypothetical protein [Streptomyces sp. A108]